MKKSIPLILLVSIAAASCGNAGRELSTDGQTLRSLDGDGLAIEIVSDYNLSSYERLLDEETDMDLIDSQVGSAMRASTLYSDADAAETWSESSRIPFCARVSERTSIFQDGSSEYVQTTDLDSGTNPLLGLRDSRPDLSSYVAKVVIKDGVSTTYNNQGVVLSSQDVEMPDYSSFLAEMQESLAESDHDTRAGISHDIDWLRAKMASRYQTKAGALPYEIYEIEGGKVVLEQDMGLTKAGEDLVVRTIYSSDIKLNYGYEQLVGGKLRVRCVNSFDPAAPAGTISEDNPVRTVVEELSFRSDGTPVVKVSDKEFSINTVRYNLK